MTRQLEALQEKQKQRRYDGIVLAVEVDLEQAIERSGGELTGFAVKYRGSDCLMIVKAILAGRPQVAFIGADDLGGCLLKAVREGNQDKLKWRADKYGGQSEGD